MSQTNDWKLGLFVLLGIGVATLTVILLGANKLEREVEYFVTYFDESVQGLERGSPVKFRGVRVGQVSEISVAPNRRHVEVTCAVDLKILQRLGLRDPTEADAQSEIPDNLRIQLVPQGITGVRFLQVDFFDAKEFPPPKLDFGRNPDTTYIPAARSTLASLEEAVVEMAAQVPVLSGHAQRLLQKVEQAVDDVAWKELSNRAVTSLERVEKLAASLDRKLKPLDVAQIQSDVTLALKEVRKTLDETDRLIARVQKEDGLLAGAEAFMKTADRKLKDLPTENLGESLKRVDGAVAAIESTSRALNVLANDARDTPRRLDHTLRALEQASRAVRDLAELLQRDADMLLKGRGRVR